MRARKIGDAEQVRNRVRPITNQRADKRFPGLGEITGIYWRQRKALRVELEIPDQMLRVDRKRAQSDATIDGIKFIEIVAGPSHRALALHHANDFKHLRLAEPASRGYKACRARERIPSALTYRSA